MSNLLINYEKDYYVIAMIPAVPKEYLTHLWRIVSITTQGITIASLIMENLQFGVMAKEIFPFLLQRGDVVKTDGKILMLQQIYYMGELKCSFLEVATQREYFYLLKDIAVNGFEFYEKVST